MLSDIGRVDPTAKSLIWAAATRSGSKSGK